MFLQTRHFCFPDLGKEKLCSILVFGNACFHIIARINHDNVASRGAVGRTHTIVRLQTRICRKDGTENFGGFVYVLDGFSQRGFALCVFMCPINFSLFSCLIFLFCLFFCLFSGYHTEGYHAPSITHWLSRPGLSRLYHHCTATTPVYIYPGYHAIFAVYRSPAITPPVLLHLHHHPGATRTNLLHTAKTKNRHN